MHIYEDWKHLFSDSRYVVVSVYGVVSLRISIENTTRIAHSYRAAISSRIIRTGVIGPEIWNWPVCTVALQTPKKHALILCPRIRMEVRINSHDGAMSFSPIGMAINHFIPPIVRCPEPPEASIKKHPPASAK